MKNATVSELKNKLSKYLRYVKEGEAIVVMDRGRPIAELTPCHHGFSSLDEHFEDLAARGIIRCGDPSLLKKYNFPDSKKSLGVLDALLEERREGR